MPGYPEAWTETLRKSHRLNFADPDAPPEAGGATSLTLDVAPLVGLVAKQVSDATTVPLEAPDQVLITIGQPSSGSSWTRCRPTRRWATPWPSGLIALHWRLLPPGGAGRSWPDRAGSLVLAGAWKLAADAAGVRWPATERQRGGGDLQERIRRGATQLRAVDPGSRVAGGVLLVVGLVLRVVGGRRRPERLASKRCPFNTGSIGA